jgi:lipoprotein-anchoring transpeptidase ErfK/SrfK
MDDSSFVKSKQQAALMVALLAGVWTMEVRGEETHGCVHDSVERDEAIRLQVFLDRANFAPGKINGRFGPLTFKALSLYRQSRGEAFLPPDESGEGRRSDIPDLSGLDLASVEPALIAYTVTEADLQNVGKLPEAREAQAKMPFLPYTNPAEAIAEKFHTDVDFLVELNPGRMGSIQAGDTLMVPNVEPFDLSALRASKAEANGPKTVKENPANETAPEVEVRVNIKEHMLTVYEGGKLVAAFPVTVGSDETASPVGEWRVNGVATLPTFRYDERMLKYGEHSEDFHRLPPGPNSPAGVAWIALNKKGIGVHGTDDPDTVGRAVSHGCVRLANWDIARLAARAKNGMSVVIR